jgi:hypothetical protein
MLIIYFFVLIFIIYIKKRNTTKKNKKKFTDNLHIQLITSRQCEKKLRWFKLLTTSEDAAAYVKLGFSEGLFVLKKNIILTFDW